MRETLETRDGRCYRFVELTAGSLPAGLFPAERHACLVVLADRQLARQLEAPFAEAVVASGCRWVTCHGENSSQWEESIDWANVAAVADFPPESDFTIMTTSHECELLSEVANMFARISDDFGPFESNLVLLVGRSVQAGREIAESLESAADGGAAS